MASDEALSVILTDDGSMSVRVNEWDECYHSRRGAVRESEHIYIESGLKEWLRLHPEAENVVVFEMGFGTGLNTLLTLKESRRHAGISFNYHSLEAWPLSPSVWRRLDFPAVDDQTFLHRLHEVPFGTATRLTDNFRLTKHHHLFEEFKYEQTFDVIYYDAFGPRVQPELWSDEAALKLKEMLHPGGMFVTYCAKGWVKRTFRRNGFLVQSPPGPPGKREMLRGWLMD